MSDELDDMLPEVTPRGAPPQLRVKVLAAVERELRNDESSVRCHARPPRQRWLSMLTRREHGTHHRKPRWERAFELGVAACLALGVGLNAWQWRADLGWRNQVDAPRIEIANRQELVAAVASITDKATAEMLIDRLVVAKDRSSTGTWNRSVKN